MIPSPRQQPLRSLLAVARCSAASAFLLITLGCSNWGTLANPGYEKQPIKTVLFFAGQPLDGTTIPNNRCGAAANGTFCYSVSPIDPYNLDWTNSVNRLLVVDEIARAGFNTLSMSTWGESWLPCTTDCTAYIEDADCRGDRTRPSTEWRCSPDARTNTKACRIGWYGSANMQISAAAKNELFDAAAREPLLVMPFIESRFGFDWDFHDDFPCVHDGYPCRGEKSLAPGLVSQLRDLIATYLTHPQNPRWPAQWAQVYDREDKPRYAVVIVQAASSRLGPNDHEAFANAFDAVADAIQRETGVKIGFLIDPIPGDPTSTFGCLDFVPVSTFGAAFRPDPVETGFYLRNARSILGIHAYSPEGWIDGKPGGGRRVNDCYKLAWKTEWSRQWRDSGIPFLQDVTPGYDGRLLFFPDPAKLLTWGNGPEWRAALLELVRTNGHKGMVYNSWNGYCEGLAGMPTTEYGITNAEWITSLLARYKK